jgi:hypothetical protein
MTKNMGSDLYGILFFGLMLGIRFSDWLYGKTSLNWLAIAAAVLAVIYIRKGIIGEGKLLKLLYPEATEIPVTVKTITLHLMLLIAAVYVIRIAFNLSTPLILRALLS